MGRTKDFHSGNVHFYTSIFTAALNQLCCPEMGSAVIWCLLFGRHLAYYDSLNGFGLWYVNVYPYPSSWIPLFDFHSGTIFMFITTSAPNKRSLGATNGLSQMTVSIARAIGPALSTSLFSFSVENNIFGGLGVYVVFAILSVLALLLATHLPPELWERQAEQDAVAS